MHLLLTDVGWLFHRDYLLFFVYECSKVNQMNPLKTCCLYNCTCDLMIINLKKSEASFIVHNIFVYIDTDD